MWNALYTILILACISGLRTKAEPTISCLAVRDRACFFTTINSKDKEDEKKFQQILVFWQRSFPKSTFEGGSVRLVDGPTRRQRLHIPVPKKIESLYMHKFFMAFLEQRSKATNELERFVANDLLGLGRGVLYTREGMTVSFDSGPPVECID